jgi:tripartite-type tricarboxylate transporter receptor subunit TctC
MMERKVRGFCSLLVAAGIALMAGAASAQGSRTIKIVVPSPPGGSVDILGRLLGQQISEAHGVKVVVESRPGAGTIVATDAVARAAPDGNTVLIVANAFVIIPHIRKLNYDPLTSFTPIAQLVTSPQVLVVNSASAIRATRPRCGLAWWRRPARRTRRWLSSPNGSSPPCRRRTSSRSS